MELNEKKEILLNTYMHKLPLSKTFKKRFDPDRPLVLREFILLNPYLKYQTDGFIGPGKEEYYFFSKSSPLWKELKKLLSDSGFTPSDWMMLISDKKVNGRTDFSSLTKDQILSLPIGVLSPGSSTNNMVGVTVADFLNREYIPFNKQASVIQEILRSLGFTEEDGHFMSIVSRDKDNMRLLRREKAINTRQGIYAAMFLSFL